MFSPTSRAHVYGPQNSQRRRSIVAHTGFEARKHTVARRFWRRHLLADTQRLLDSGSGVVVAVVDAGSIRTSTSSADESWSDSGCAGAREAVEQSDSFLCLRSASFFCRASSMLALFSSVACWSCCTLFSCSMMTLMPVCVLPSSARANRLRLFAVRSSFVRASFVYYSSNCKVDRLRIFSVLQLGCI